MPFPLDVDTEAAIAAGRVKPADLIDFYLRDGAGDPLTLRCWTWPGEASYPGTVDLDGSTSSVTYETMYGRLAVAKQIRMAASLSSEPIVITLDGSRSDDDDDWVGRFVDATWHQARVRVRGVLRNFDTGALLSLPHWEWRGLIDHRNLSLKDGEPATWEVKCQGALFRVRGRRLKTRSHEDQQVRSAGDNFYIGTPRMVGLPLMWGRYAVGIPGVETLTGNDGRGIIPGLIKPRPDQS